MRICISLSALNYVVKKPYGILKAAWKNDLADEEDDEYLPAGYDYNKVLELVIIRAATSGNGYGDKLMKEFLASPTAKSAELIFLDPVPNVFDGHRAVPEQVQIKKLQAFYEKYGFKRNPKSNRMWLVQKGIIPDKKLPM